MAVQSLTMDNLNQIINSNDIVVIDFWAPWCGPCQTFKPIFEEASDRHPDTVFASCNTEEESEMAAMFQIRSSPRWWYSVSKSGSLANLGCCRRKRSTKS